jgi:hypothetical protein
MRFVLRLWFCLLGAAPVWAGGDAAVARSGRPAIRRGAIDPVHHAVITLRMTLQQIGAIQRELGVRLPAEVERSAGRLQRALGKTPQAFVHAVRQELAVAARGLRELGDAFQREPLEDHLCHRQLSQRDKLLYAAATAATQHLRQRVGPALGRAAAQRRGSASRVSVLHEHSVAGINAGLRPERPTVDLDVHLVRGSGVTWSMIRQELALARRTYAPYGIQLRLRSARELQVPEQWLELRTQQRSAMPDAELLATDPYRYLRQMETRLTAVSAEAFTAMIRGVPSPDRALQIVTLRRGSFPWVENGQPMEVDARADSFPPYIWSGALPRGLRGLIGLFPYRHPAGELRPAIELGMLGHEMGHKLINVSHEGRAGGPEHESFAGGSRDLMIYGFGLEVPAGAEGRWQQQRLRRSPFLYTGQGKDKVYNADFEQHGRYDDPLYGPYHVAY